MRDKHNSILITPKKRESKRGRSTNDDVNDVPSRSDHFIATQTVGIEAARKDSERCYEEALAHDITPAKRLKLLTTAMELSALCDSLQTSARRQISFAQTDSGLGKVVLSRVPAELKSSMDYKPIIPVTEFFSKARRFSAI